MLDEYEEASKGFFSFGRSMVPPPGQIGHPSARMEIISLGARAGMINCFLGGIVKTLLPI
jgi:hypothetical protein